LLLLGRVKEGLTLGLLLHDDKFLEGDLRDVVFTRTEDYGFLLVSNFFTVLHYSSTGISKIRCSHLYCLLYLLLLPLPLFLSLLLHLHLQHMPLWLLRHPLHCRLSLRKRLLLPYLPLHPLPLLLLPPQPILLLLCLLPRLLLNLVLLPLLCCLQQTRRERVLKLDKIVWAKARLHRVTGFG